MVALFIILYIIVGILVVMGYIFYETRIKHEKVNLDDEDDNWIFCAGLFWPLFGALGLFWLICHLIYMFFDWFTNCLQEEDEEHDK